MSESFLDRLQREPCLLLDGGLGSMLLARGLPAGAPPESWNLDARDALRDVHAAYAIAGADAVHANTFGANVIRLARYGLADRHAEINENAVRAAREGCVMATEDRATTDPPVAGPATADAMPARRRVFVIGDLGPTGEYLPPVGNGRLDVWREAFLRQARVLAACGVDALHVETMSDLREAMVALEAAVEAAPGLPVLVSLTFDRRPRGFFTVMGDPLVASLRRLHEAGATAVGANCTLSSSAMVELARVALDAGVPLVVQPNAGQPEWTPEGPRYAQAPEEFAEEMAALVAGDTTRAQNPTSPRGHIAAVGGCCGTDPRFIAALRVRLDALAT